MPDQLAALRGIQLDLKYQMPRKDYFLRWMKRLPGYGINAILLEYEDKFPFEKYPFVRDPDAFTPDELHEFLDTARGAGLIVIPLVQTFAHLEFCLSHKQLAHLRETPEICPKVCASNPAAAAFVADLVGEIVAAHEEDEYIHLGGDEVWHTGWCDTCQARIDEIGPIRFWCDFEQQFIDIVRQAGKRAIIWDDIFWKDFDAVHDCGLPKDVVLNAWNYNLTKLGGDAGDSDDAELGGAGGVLKQIETYQAAGYETVAAPCYNFGQLFTRHTHSLRNTLVWAKKMRDSGMLGMLNTAWACFHMPLAATNLHVAATGELCRDPETPVESDAWQRDWLKAEFGGPADGVPAALEVLGEHFTIPTPEYGRPFTPIAYCYMNMVLHYPGHHSDRQLIGPYPRDWDEIDFTEMYRKGIAAARAQDTLDGSLATLDEMLAAYPAAVAAIEGLAAGATRNGDEAEMLAVFARLKLTSGKVLRFLLTDEGDGAALAAELAAQKDAVAAALGQCWEPLAAERMMRPFWHSLYEALNA